MKIIEYNLYIYIYIYIYITFYILYSYWKKIPIQNNLLIILIGRDFFLLYY